jgi:predicted esterase
MSSGTSSAEITTAPPGAIIEIHFSTDQVPPTLYSLMNGVISPAVLTIQLPDDYVPDRSYPLVVYVPGNDGGPKGSIHNARTIAGPRGWIAATVPLFKKVIDRGEPGGGVIVSFDDYTVISTAYRTMLGHLFDRFPNIDRQRSAMVGFSNGAITIGVLLSNHDEFVLTHFRNFCLVDHGMFHLTDVHKERARGARFLILVGDRQDLGRDLKLRQSQLLHDAGRLLGVNVTHRVLKDTGHEFRERHMAIVGEWLRNDIR